MMWILVLSHSVAAFIGAVVTYFGVTRYTKIVEFEGHPAIEILPQEERMSHPFKQASVWIVVLSIVAVVVGIQVYLGKRAEAENDRRDAVYATCIKEYAQEGLKTIVDTAVARNAANKDVEKAVRLRDNAVDHVLKIVLQARRIPPRATEAEFDAALKQAARAKAKLRFERREARKVKIENQYTVPVPECER